MTYSVGVDIGGTFTDCVVVTPLGEMATGKVPTTPDDFTVGFFGAIEDAARQLGVDVGQLFAETQTVMHATTVGSNAVVQGRGAKVGLIATKGHGEALYVMRGSGRTKGLGVDELLDIPSTAKPPEIVPRALVGEVAERVDKNGTVLLELSDADAERAIGKLLEQGAEAIAVSLLWSFLRPEHEQRVRDLIHKLSPGTFVSCSHEVAPQVGEYYRTVATVMNAYLGPLMSSYVDQIVAGAETRGYDRPVLFAQCIGGADRVEAIRRKPLFTLDSGPVSGVVASQYVGETCADRNIITADMGGTTLDVCVLPDGSPLRRETTIWNQYEMYLPMVDVESIGAGGGSIAWVDRGHNSLRVGPHSAGAAPGPVCYDQGGMEPTVTDANLVLGVLNPHTFLRGRRSLDVAAGRRAIGEVGDQLGLSTEQVAAGMTEIVESAMAEQIRRMTMAHGYDPRDFVMYAFGGAAGAHAAAMAAELEISQVVVPLADMASVFSAMGTVTSDVAQVHDRSVRYAEPFDLQEIGQVFDALGKDALEGFVEAGFDSEAVTLRRVLSVKYAAQVYDVEIPFLDADDQDDLIERFEVEYARQFGQDAGFRAAGIELTRQRVYASAALPRPRLSAGSEDVPGAAGETAAGDGCSRPVWWRTFGEERETQVLGPEDLRRGMPTVSGPAIVDLPDTTVVVRPMDTLDVDEYGNLRITIGASEPSAIVPAVAPDPIDAR